MLSADQPDSLGWTVTALRLKTRGKSIRGSKAGKTNDFQSSPKGTEIPTRAFLSSPLGSLSMEAARGRRRPECITCFAGLYGT